MIWLQGVSTRVKPVWPKSVVQTGLMAFLVALAVQQAGAWSRGIPNWASMVDGAEVIAVAHIVDIPVYVAHQRAPGDGMSWEFHARLVIDEVLKGQCAEHEIPIILHYGLSPSEYTRDGKRERLGGADTNETLVIHDTGTTSGDGSPVLNDARKPAVWLLAHYSDRFGAGNRPTANLGIREPEHVQPITMLPFLRSILKPEPIQKQLAFLCDPDPRIRLNCLQYFIDRKERRAFPAVANMLGDPDRRVSELAISGCQLLGGKASIPRLRALLGSDNPDTFGFAAYALAELHDTSSIPQLAQALTTGVKPGQRRDAALALKRMGDPSAILSLISALKDDGCVGVYSGTEVWCEVRDALEALTWCQLSPNDDKAARWWQAAQAMPPEIWHHFGLADTVAAMPLLGPEKLEQACMTWRARCGVSIGTFLDVARFGVPTYSPTATQELWRQWLADQGWDGYRTLPSQVDDELKVSVEATAPLNSGKPVRLQYVLTNNSRTDIWLTRRYSELLDVKLATGNGYYTAASVDRSEKPITAGDFLRLRPGEQWKIAGDGIIWNDPHDIQHNPPRLLAAALHFGRKGTSCGVDAWVGDVWAEPIVVR